MNLKKIIREEMGDMDWIQDVPDNLNGIKFTHIDEPSKVYIIRDTEISPRRNEYHSYITVLNMRGQVIQQSVRRKNAYSNFKNGRWIIYDEKINESNDMQWIEDVSPSDLYVGVRFRLESPHPKYVIGPIFTVTEVLGDEFTSIDTEGYVWVVNIDAWQEWKNENNLYILEPNKDLMLKGSYKMGDDLVATKKKGG